MLNPENEPSASLSPASSVSNNIHLLTPEVAKAVLDLANKSAETRSRELEYAHQWKMISLQQRGLQFERAHSLKVWSLIAALLITCFTVFGGISLVFMGHENAGMVTIALGAGLTLAGVLFKRAEQLFSQKFSGKQEDPPA